MSGRTDYEERRQARVDRLNEAAGKATERSISYSKRSSSLVKDIPLGQPNIIGRPALPRLREKSARAMDKAVEESSKADYYADRAEAAESNRAISSDDPKAAEKIKAKIAALEDKKAKIKAFNREARKSGTEPAPWYELPYASKEIKRLKDRLAKLEQVDQMPAEVITFDGGKIISDVETNRVMIRHDEKPDAEIIQALKRNGFHWARSEGAWTRLRNPAALRIAKRICGMEESK